MKTIYFKETLILFSMAVRYDFYSTKFSLHCGFTVWVTRFFVPEVEVGLNELVEGPISEVGSKLYIPSTINTNLIFLQPKWAVAAVKYQMEFHD